MNAHLFFAETFYVLWISYEIVENAEKREDGRSICEIVGFQSYAECRKIIDHLRTVHDEKADRTSETSCEVFGRLMYKNDSGVWR